MACLLSVKGKPVSSLTWRWSKKSRSRFHSVVARARGLGPGALSNADQPRWKGQAHTDLKAIQVAQDHHWLTATAGWSFLGRKGSLEQLHKASSTAMA